MADAEMTDCSATTNAAVLEANPPLTPTSMQSPSPASTTSSIPENHASRTVFERIAMSMLKSARRFHSFLMDADFLI